MNSLNKKEFLISFDERIHDPVECNKDENMAYERDDLYFVVLFRLVRTFLCQL